MFARKENANVVVTVRATRVGDVRDREGSEEDFPESITCDDQALDTVLEK